MTDNWMLSSEDLRDLHDHARLTAMNLAQRLRMERNAYDRALAQLKGWTPASIYGHAQLDRRCALLSGIISSTEMAIESQTAVLDDLEAELNRRDPPRHWYRRNGQRRY